MQTVEVAIKPVVKIILKSDTEILDEVVAVSYTHLDVYKRQDQNLHSVHLSKHLPLQKTQMQSQYVHFVFHKLLLPLHQVLSLIHI